MITGDGLLAHHRLRSGAGVPLVLLHGFPLDSRMWLDVVDLLPGEPDVIALDLPGMGESPTGPDVAATLGARPSRVLWRVTLPRLLPGLAAGAVLAFARALGEFGATLTFAGSLQGTTRTLPLEIYLRREADTDAALALALVLMVVAAVLVVVAYGATDRRASRAGREVTP